MRPSFEESVNMVLQDVNEDDYMRKEVSCSKTMFMYYYVPTFEILADILMSLESI